MIYQTIRAKWGNNFISIQGNLANQSLSNFVAERAAQRDLPNNTCKMGEQLHFHSRKPGESVSKQLRCGAAQRDFTKQYVQNGVTTSFPIQGNLANQSSKQLRCRKGQRKRDQTIRAKWGNNFISIQGNLANQSLSNFVAERAAQREPNNTCKMGEQLHFSIQGNLANRDSLQKRTGQRDLPNNTCKMGEQLHFHSRKPGESERASATWFTKQYVQNGGTTSFPFKETWRISL